MKKQNIIAVSILALIIILLAFFQTPVMAAARHTAWNLWVQQVARRTKLGDIHTPETVQQQLEFLRAENVRLRSQQYDYERLKTQIGSPSFESMRVIPAATAGRPIDTFQSEYMLNKGLEDGVTPNAPVVVQGSVLVGFIVEVAAHSATMRTLFHPTAQLTVETVSLDADIAPARGLLRSFYYTSLSLTTIPRDQVIESGLSVVTVSKESTIPQGLVIGTIQSITSEENEAYQQARIEVPYDIDRIDAVHILVAP